MSHATHKITLGKHSEHVTAAQLEGLKKTLGSRFSEYTVDELQVAKPKDVEAPESAKTKKDAPKAE